MPPGSPPDPRPTASDLHGTRWCSAGMGGGGARERKGDFSVGRRRGVRSGTGPGEPELSVQGSLLQTPPPRSHRGGARGRVRHEGLPDPEGRPGGGQPHGRRDFKGGNYRAHSVFKTSLVLLLKMCFFFRCLPNALQRKLSLRQLQENVNAQSPSPRLPGHRVRHPGTAAPAGAGPTRRGGSGHARPAMASHQVCH